MKTLALWFIWILLVAISIDMSRIADALQIIAGQK